MIKTSNFILCLMSLTLAQAQSVNIDEFKSKLFLSAYVLIQQPSKELISRHVPAGYKLDSVKSYGYFFTDRESKSVAIHMDYYNKQMRGIQFFEPKERYQSLIDFLKSEKKYKIANRSLDNKSWFFSDGTVAITLWGDDPVNVNIMANIR